MIDSCYARERCINLDWLEVHVQETGKPRDPDYFRNLGFPVDERDYGTRVFAQMFTILDPDGHPFMEVRRKPKTPILSEYDAHLRLTNRACYFDNAAGIMLQFIHDHDYLFVKITRADICLDFPRFDSNDDPARFMRRYMEGRYSKINQSNIHAHGTDHWEARVWNSVSWGSPASDIGTKFYNKTLELYDPASDTYKKPYIRQAWALCHFIDDVNRCTKLDDKGLAQKVTIWRVEFSIKSSVKNWMTLELDGKRKNYQSIRNTLECYQGREKLLILFASLANHYFHFKHYHEDTRKDRCPDKVLFDFEVRQAVYKVGKTPLLSEKKAPADLAKLASRLRDFRESHVNKEIHDACNIILSVLEKEEIMHELNHKFSREELEAFRIVMSMKSRGIQGDSAVLLRQIKALLNINDNTAIF